MAQKKEEKMKRKNGSKTAKKSDQQLVGVLVDIYQALDDLGLRNRIVNNPRLDYPGTTEKIAMELEDIKKILGRLADHLTGVGD